MSKTKIMIVEDARITAEEMKEHLQSLNYDVCAIESSGPNAIKQAQEHLPDIILMDIKINGEMNGIDAAKIIKETLDIPVIFTTAHSDKITLKKTKSANPYGFILKPLNYQEIEAMIQTSLNKYQTEKRTREHNAWLKTILKSIGDGVIATDLEGIITFINPVAELLTGWTETNAKGKQISKIFTIIDHKTNQTLPNPINTIIEQTDTKITTTQSLLLSKDGMHTPIDLSGSPILDDKENLLGAVLVFKDTSERIQAESEILEIRKRFHEVIEASPLGVHMYELMPDDRLVFIDANKTADKILSTDNKQFIGKTIEEAFPPLAETEIPEQYRKVASSGQAWRTEQIAYQDDAISGAYEVYAFQTKANTLAAMFLDITERKKGEIKLKESEEKHRSLFESMTLGVVYQDTEGQIISANPASQDILGLTLDQMQGRTSLDPRWKAIHEDGSDFEGNNHPAMVALKTGKKVTNVLMGVFNPIYEEYRWIKVSSVPQFRNNETKPFQTFTIFDDMTESKKAQETIKESEERFRGTFEQAAVGVALFTPDGRIMQINQRFCEIVGCSQENILENTLHELTHPDDIDFDKAQKQRLLNGEISNYNLEKRFIKKDGQIVWVNKTVSLVSETSFSPKYFVAVVEDITETKEAHIQIEKDLKEKEVLLQEIHHRVKNNLQVISSLLNLQSDHIYNEEALATLHDSKNRVRAMALVHEKLYQSHDFSNLDISEYIKSLVKSLFKSYQVEKASIKLNMQLDTFSMAVDKAVPCGLIINELLSNALKYAFPSNYEIEPEILLSVQKKTDNNIELIVQDNGIGLPDGLNYRVTDTLGLHLVTLLGEKQLDGSVTLNQENGTSFHVIFKDQE